MEHEEISEETALCGALRVITICTHHFASTKRYNNKILKLPHEGPISLDDSDSKRLKSLWGIEDSMDFEYHVFASRILEEGLQIRVLHMNQEISSIYESHHPRNIGVHSIVFHSTNWNKINSKIKEKGVRKVKGLKRLDEAEVKNERTKILGPSQLFYEVVSDDKDFIEIEINSDAFDQERKFFSKVLGHPHFKISNYELNEVGVQYHTVSSSIKDDTAINFIEFEDNFYKEVNEPPRIPNEGIGMLSFETKDIGEVLARCHAHQFQVYRTPRKVNDPIYGEAISMTILAPTGMLIEVYNKS